MVELIELKWKKAASDILLAAFNWMYGGLALLKVVLKRSSIQDFVYIKLISHPHLYPQFAFDTPVEEYLP